MIGVSYKNESRTATAGFIHLAHEWGRVPFYSLLDILGERMLGRHKTVTNLLLLIRSLRKLKKMLNSWQ